MTMANLNARSDRSSSPFKNQVQGPQACRRSVLLDVALFIGQCCACQIQRLELQQVEDLQLPRMTKPFQHIHIDLAGPFALKSVKSSHPRGKVGRMEATMSTEIVGQGYICLIVDYFTKGAEFVFSAEKAAMTVANPVHDH